ncbi:MAG: hypothetical protein U0K91_07280 [Acutalibacteraceae bacterium]|nr:hypothetical protein [Acutalibacteraceae bacterium]
MKKQDKQGVRTAADVERKYNLGKMNSSQGLGTKGELILNQIKQTLSQYMATTNAKITELQSKSLDNIDETLKIDEATKKLGVNTADVVELGNKLPVTSNAVALKIAELIFRIEKLEDPSVVSDTSAILGKARLGIMLLGKEA